MCKDSEFIAREHEYASTRVGSAVVQMQKIEMYTIVGVAAVFAFVLGPAFNSEQATNTLNSGIQRYAILIPFILTLVGFVRWFMQRLYLESCTTYLKRLEKLMGSSPTFQIGWEHFYNDDKESHQRQVRLFRFLFWAGLFAITGSVGFLTFLANMAS